MIPAKVVIISNFLRLNFVSEYFATELLIVTPPSARIVIKTPNPALLIPTSSIPKSDEKGIKNEVENPKMVLIKNKIGNDGIFQMNTTFSLNAKIKFFFITSSILSFGF